MLAAIIIDAVVFGMIDLPEMRRLWRLTRVDFWIAVAAVVGVLTSGVLAGVVIGMVLSLAWLGYVNARPGDISSIGEWDGGEATSYDEIIRDRAARASA